MGKHKQRILVDKEKRIAYIAVAAGLLIFLSYVYGDFIVTQRSGYALWDAVPAVGFRNYYQFLRENHFASAYNFTVYLLFAVWNLPCWIFEKITGLQAQNYVIWLLYGKALILGGYILSVRLLCDIFRIIREGDEIREASFSEAEARKYMALSLPMLWFSVFTGNYDILEIVFILAGIKAALEDKEWQFILFFAIGASMKSYSLFAFVPIMLLREKRILHIIKNAVFSVSILVVEELLFRKEQYFASVGSSISTDVGAVKSILTGGIFTQFGGLGNASLCLCLYIGLCAYAYLQPRKDNHHFFRKTIYVSMLAFMILFSTIHFNVYMIIFLAPFLSLMVVTADRERAWAYILLECMLIYLLMMIGMMRAHWVVGSHEYYHGLNAVLSGVFGLRIGQPMTIGEFFMLFNEGGALSLLINSLTIVVMMIVSIFFYPGERLRSLIRAESPGYSAEACMRFRNGINGIAFLLPTIWYVLFVLVDNR